ncbi:MAG: hypothetical protein CSA84_01835 [Actinomycetales bacterium]|nr:MAG: hypothetical protein CSA84_01835 [Actinomycetales bacterium]
MIALPLSARAALWATAVLHGRAPLDQARSRAYAGVTDVTGTLPEPDSWPARGETAVLLALPRPGSFTGMPRAPRESLTVALDAGECLVAPTVGGVLVPTIEEFGPVGDTGRLLTWTAHPAEPLPRHVVEAVDLRELDRSLTGVVRDATERVEALGGIPWRSPAMTTNRTDIRAAVLPDGVPPRAARLMIDAAVVHAVALEGLAEEHGGAATDAATSSQRAAVFRTVLDTADDTLAGAVNVAAMVLAGWRPA